MLKCETWYHQKTVIFIFSTIHTSWLDKCAAAGVLMKFPLKVLYCWSFFFFLNNLLSAFFRFKKAQSCGDWRKRFNQKHPLGISSPTKRPLHSSTLSMSSTAGRNSTAGRCMAQCSASPLCDLECCRTARYPVFLISAKVNKVDLKTPVTRSLHAECTSMASDLVTQTLCVHCSSDNVC